MHVFQMPNKQKLCNTVTQKYVHAIRNYEILSPNTLLQINALPFEDRLQVLKAYNEMIMNIVDVLEGMA
jgi:hypothetical protein